MNINLENLINKNETVAVALSGGSDSMALLYYMISISEKFPFKVVALNVEHGIRGKDSLDDSMFVKSVCQKLKVPLIEYSVDSIKKSVTDKLSLEESARILRYQCFFDAIEKGKCDKVATAHHKKDNAESVLFNLFRGTGLKGVTGIEENFKNKIIRPFLSVSKSEITEFIEQNKIPYVTDKTNFDSDYTRNYLRLNIMPEIEKIFPEFEESILRFCKIAKLEDDYLDKMALSCVKIYENNVTISIPLERAIFNRAVIIALRKMGIEKDWEKVHIDGVYNLSENKNGSRMNLADNIVAIREYDKIVFYKDTDAKNSPVPFSTGTINFGKNILKIEQSEKTVDLKSGLFADKDKIPANAVIRTRAKNDKFTKFNGGTKSLGDYFTDNKIPVRVRDSIPLLAYENKILVIFGYAVSDNVKVDSNTNEIIKFTKEGTDYGQF